MTASLKDLTSREAVLAALVEFDALGRDAFLKRYGFGRSHLYYVHHNGGYFDAKSAYQNDSSALRSLRQIRLQPIARNASWMSSRRS